MKELALEINNQLFLPNIPQTIYDITDEYSLLKQEAIYIIRYLMQRELIEEVEPGFFMKLFND